MHVSNQQLVTFRDQYCVVAENDGYFAFRHHAGNPILISKKKVFTATSLGKSGLQSKFMAETRLRCNKGWEILHFCASTITQRVWAAPTHLKLYFGKNFFLYEAKSDEPVCA